MSRRNRNKEKLVDKVSQETNVDPQDLDRLPVEALNKLDDLVPDEFPEDDIQIYASAEITEGEVFQHPSEDQSAGDLHDSLEESNDPDFLYYGKKGRKVGHHPVTKEPVYR